MWWLKFVSLPCCGTVPDIDTAVRAGENIEDGQLRCSSCDRTYAIRDGIIRLGEPGGYASSFGLQWRRFSAAQIDHLNGTRISEKRLVAIAGRSLDFLEDRVVYDAGCGAGRFTAIAHDHGAFVIAADPAEGAIEACRRNTRGSSRVVCIHSSPLRVPVQTASVDVAMSIGVYQHTPDPLAYLGDLAGVVRPGGRLLLWGYERRARSVLHPKYVLRPLTRRIQPERLLRTIETCAPALLVCSDAVRRLPAGKLMSRMVPIANYRGVLPLDERQRLDWAILDTFDWLSARYDRPLPFDLVTAALAGSGLHVARTLDDSISVFCERPLT